MKIETTVYTKLLKDIKQRVRMAQVRATFSANAEMILMYWDIGKIIYERQQEYGWGAKVIQKLSTDIDNELSEVKGYSERNLKFMVRFYKEYSVESEKVKQLVSQIPWGHNIVLFQKIESKETRYWYMLQTMQNGWSRDVLLSMIKSELHKRQGTSISNFKTTLPSIQSDLAIQTIKDPYLFDFFTLSETFNERELEISLVKHLEKFLIELGEGFAFVGRQYHLEVSDRDFYIDLLFYHLKLRSYIVIELKKGEFKPEYAGKLNFYCSAVDDKLKHETDNPTIGLILCQSKDKIFAEYALKDINKPIGISEYQLTQALPSNYKGSLPSIKELEEQMSKELDEKNN